MGGLLGRKLRRELWSQRWQSGAVVIVMALGCLLFVTAYAGYLDLASSYAVTQERLALADWHMGLARPLTAAQLAAVRAAPGVASAETRLVRSVPLVIADGKLAEGVRGRCRVEARVISLPARGQPQRLDRLLVESGALPGPGEVLLEAHLARHHGLGPGDRVELVLPGGRAASLAVSGVAVSAEYLWVARDRQDLMPSPSEFGVVFMDRAAVADLLPDATDGELLIGLADGADPEAVRDAALAALDPGQVRQAVARERLIGVELLDDDVEGLGRFAAFFPFFFLGVGAFIVAALVGRIVESQRPLIGTMVALGTPRRRVLGHYLAYALVLCGAGALAGVLAGALAGQALTRIYAAELGIPFVSAAFHPWLMLGGVAIGLGVGALSGALPAWRASRLRPAEAMRPPAPPAGRLLGWTRRGFGALPLPARMAARNVLRRPIRNLTTSLGVAAALVLVLVGNEGLASLEHAIDFQFEQAQRYDLRIDLVTPRPAEGLLEAAARVEGVQDAEVFLAFPAWLAAGEKRYLTLLQALPDRARLQRSVDFDGREILPADGLVLARALGRELGVAPGDTVTATVMPFGRPLELRVDGFSDATIGNSATMRLDAARRALALPGLASTVVARVAGPAERVAVRRAWQELPGVARVTDVGAMREQIDDWMGFSYLLIGIMLAFSVVLAAAVLFNTATLSILERQRELATMRALGTPMRDLTVMITVEHALLAVVGSLLGLPAAIVLIRRVLALYESDFFTLPFVLTPTTFVLTALGALGVLLLAQWPSLRLVASMNLADAVRTRE